jgi:hypothetical protein
MDDHTILPNILHKGSADDVLIRNPKVALPLYIMGSIIKTCACSPILRHYISSDDERSKFHISQAIQGKNPADGLLGGGAADDHAWSHVRALPYQIVMPHLLDKTDATGLNGADLAHAVAALCEAIPACQRSSSFQFINEADNYFWVFSEWCG